MRKMDSWQNSTSKWLSKKNLNFFFRWKKNIFWKWAKIFFKIEFSKIIFSKSIFQKIFFFDEKKSWENFWITMSMWNFVRNPFFASINAGAVLKVQNALWKHPMIFDFWDSSNFTGSIQYFIGSIARPNFCVSSSACLTLI